MDICASHFIPVEGLVHVLDLLAVEDLLHEAGPDVGGGAHTRGRDAGDEDGRGGPGGERGEDSPGDGEAPAHYTHPGPHGLTHSASVTEDNEEPYTRFYYLSQILSKYSALTLTLKLQNVKMISDFFVSPWQWYHVEH